MCRGLHGAGVVVTPAQAALSEAGNVLIYVYQGQRAGTTSASSTLDRVRAAELLSSLTRQTVEKVLVLVPRRI